MVTQALQNSPDSATIRAILYQEREVYNRYMSIVLHKIADTTPVVKYIASILRQHLENNQTVLWLVPGGSSITIAAEVSKQLHDLPLHNLMVTLTDERYGSVGHTDSNWQQLIEAGFLLPNAQLFPVLLGKNREETVSDFATRLEILLTQANYRLGFFGIGADGHTAGILPGSPAVTTKTLAAGYDAGNFQRITMTFPAIQQLNEVVAYATGEAKWPVLNQLANETLSLEQQPAQILKAVSKATIFNDYIDSGA